LLDVKRPARRRLIARLPCLWIAGEVDAIPFEGR
jgi:hypothetical protein